MLHYVDNRLELAYFSGIIYSLPRYPCSRRLPPALGTAAEVLFSSHPRSFRRAFPLRPVPSSIFVFWNWSPAYTSFCYCFLSTIRRDFSSFSPE